MRLQSQPDHAAALSAAGPAAPLPVRWELIQIAAYTWIVIGSVFYLWDLLRQTRVGLTNGILRALGDDFLNYWSGAALAWRGSLADIYATEKYHAFQETVVGASTLEFFHYSYPPVMLVLTAPLAALPYVPALAVWLAASWYAFYRALCLALPAAEARLLSLAAPALFINAVGGQNGAWTAALLGGGLCLLDRRPFIAGMLMGLLVYKPQLGILLPIALLAGRRWRAFAGASVAAAGLIALSVLLFGLDLWGDFWRKFIWLRQAVLEDGVGTGHRLVSVFVFARMALDAPLAYAVQAVAAVAAAAVVAYAWWRDIAAEWRNALLILGTFVTTPYLHDYDLVVGAFVVAWLAGVKGLTAASRQQVFIVSALVLLVPIVGVSLKAVSQISFGAVFMMVVFAMAARMALANSAPRTA
jgi:arabinofuranan 3-O-arabinosyltransferase